MNQDVDPVCEKHNLAIRKKTCTAALAKVIMAEKKSQKQSREVFYKKNPLKTFAIFTETSFLIKLEVVSPGTLL